MTDYVPPAERIHRYSPGERFAHWIVAICFVLAALSGLALLHPALFWLSSFFGGGPWTRILHPFIGLAMFIAFAVFAVWHMHDNIIDASDRKWLMQWRDIAANRMDRLPEAGKYNAGQKVLYWLLVLLMLALLVTGFLFWRPWFAHLFPISVARFGALVHALAAIGLILLVIGHIYMAIWTKYSVRAMILGWVTPRWARHHHPRWYREVTQGTPERR
jgi:formate dehydrogenase subunit gamma